MKLNKKILTTTLALALSTGAFAFGASSCATNSAGKAKTVQKGCGANSCGGEKGSVKSCGGEKGADKGTTSSCGANSCGSSGSEKGSDKSCG